MIEYFSTLCEETNMLLYGVTNKTASKLFVFHKIIYI